MTADRFGEGAERAPWELTFPQLYCSADTASNRRQCIYLRLIRAEYALLLAAGVLSLNLSTAAWHHTAYAGAFLLALALLVYRMAKKPEQEWYKCRALAESVKTSTWLYVMRAQPFDAEEQGARQEFRARLADVLKSNEHIGGALAEFSSDGDQITAEMERMRSVAWKARREFYIQHRIKDQRSWYSKRAADNRRWGRYWSLAGVSIYIIAVALVLCRIHAPETAWPIVPFVVAASTVLGWMQIKKFNELASVYTLTAHEIGLIQSKLQDVDKESEFTDFVNEAELAFSREHTQWVARQTKRY
jgi:hypothetical protein